MFYLEPDDWSPRYDPTFFTARIDPGRSSLLSHSPFTSHPPPSARPLAAMPQPSSPTRNHVGGNTSHPATYYRVVVSCGRVEHACLRRYSNFAWLLRRISSEEKKGKQEKEKEEKIKRRRGGGSVDDDRLGPLPSLPPEIPPCSYLFSTYLGCCTPNNSTREKTKYRGGTTVPAGRRQVGQENEASTKKSNKRIFIDGKAWKETRHDNNNNNDDDNDNINNDDNGGEDEFTSARREGLERFLTELLKRPNIVEHHNDALSAFLELDIVSAKAMAAEAEAKSEAEAEAEAETDNEQKAE